MMKDEPDEQDEQDGPDEQDGHGMHWIGLDWIGLERNETKTKTEVQGMDIEHSNRRDGDEP
jgi:hypothetical protein